MFDNIASIDIGYSSVKLIKAKRGFHNFEIISVNIEEYNLDLFEKDSTEAVNSALQRLLDKEDLNDFRIVTSIPSDTIIFRNITFPFSDISKIAEAIPFEAEESIPYPLDSLVIDFQSIHDDSSTGSTVILSALNKQYLEDTFINLKECGICPVFAGLESNAHLRCYEYFNSVNNENILVIDLGHKKTVVNIIANSSLLFTRSVNTGISNIVKFISDILNVSKNEARAILKDLDLDLGSFDSNIKTENYKKFNISKPRLKKIHDYSCELITGIVEDISLTIKAGSSFDEFTDFGRIIITGGGSNIRGISKIISDEIGIPVVFMPFFQGYLDPDVRSRFSVSLGNILVFMNHKNSSVNFLKGNFSSDFNESSTGKYLLPSFFIVLAIIVFIINIIITFIQISRSQSYTDDILREKYRRYFNTQNIPEDPVKEALLLLQKEQKELNVLKELIGDEEPFIPALYLITENFERAEGFDIRRLNFDGKSITIEGEANKTSELESFKKNLLDSGEFETVSLNIRDTSKSRSLFTMTIKKKLQ